MIDRIKNWVNSAVIAGGALLGELLAFNWQVIVWLVTIVYGVLQIVYMVKRIRRMDEPHEHHHGGRDAGQSDNTD